MFDIEAFDNVSSGASKGPRIWSYGSTTDNKTTINASGYFDSIRWRIEPGDLIYVSASDGVEQLIVTSNTGTEPVTTTVYAPSASGTLGVASGGTGVTTMTTTYAPVISGTTPTGPLQVADGGLENAGWVLTSNGSATKPSFQAADAGIGAALPTVANNLAFFTDTAGTVSSGASSAIHNGSLQTYGNFISGKSDGTQQGGLQLYPPDAASGYFLIQALNAGGNFTTTLYTNPNQSGNKSFLFPNAVTNNELYLAAYDGAAPPTEGNMAVYGSNLGLLTDGGAPVRTANVAMTATQWNAMSVTPFQIVAAPPSGFCHIVLSYDIFLNYSAQFLGGGVVVLQWGNVALGAGTSMVGGIAGINFTGVTSCLNQQTVIAKAATAASAFNGLGLFLSNQTAPFTNGVGNTLRVVVSYITVATGI